MLSGRTVLWQDELRSVLLNILRIGLLRIRAYGWNGRADLCAIEADHLHNLPGEVQEPKLDLLLYYYNVSRTDFINRAQGAGEFEANWKRLGDMLAQMHAVDDGTKER